MYKCEVQVAGLKLKVSATEKEVIDLIKDKYSSPINSWIGEALPLSICRVNSKEWNALLSEFGSKRVIEKDCSVLFIDMINIEEGRDSLYIKEVSSDGVKLLYHNLNPGFINRTFKYTISLSIANLGGLHIHSSGVVEDGVGYLFYGPPGAGKSTAQKLCLKYGTSPMGEDGNYIVKSVDHYLVYQSPFNRPLYSYDKKAELMYFPELKAAFKLIKDTQFKVSKLSIYQFTHDLIEVTKKFIYKMSISNHPIYTQTITKTLKSLDEVSALVPAFELHFSKDYLPWIELKERLKDVK
ncbi:MAG: ATP-binding protein [bacterium]|nr:ATP-binding protein [bacterium]